MELRDSPQQLGRRMGLSRKSIGGAVELRAIDVESHGKLMASRKSIGGAVELRDMGSNQGLAGRRCRKSIGGAVELRGAQERCPGRCPGLVARASEVLWSSEADGSTLRGSCSPKSQEHRRCCGAPRSSRSRRRPMRFRSQEHRRCCGAPRKRRPQEGNRLTPSQEHRGCCGASRRTMHADLHAHRFVARASGLPWGFETATSGSVRRRPRSRKSIGAAVELRDRMHQQKRARVARRKSIGAAVELRACHTRPLGHREVRRKSIGGAVELRGGRPAGPPTPPSWSKEHRRCCGAPSGG